MKPTQKHNTSSEAQFSQLAITAESIGNFIEYWGFKSIHGRIWSLVFLSEQPISTPEIVEELQISKASASIGINDLLDQELIKTSGKIKNGAVTYTPTNSAGAVVRKILKERELKLISDTELNLKKLLKSSKSELQKKNISYSSIQELLMLTQVSKKTILGLVNDPFSTISSWTASLKRSGLRLTRSLKHVK